MKKGVIFIIFSVFNILFLGNCAKQVDFLSLKDRYLGEEPPGKNPRVFARGIISQENAHEYCMAMTPDGKEIYFSRAGVGVMVCSWTGSEWTSPARAGFSGRYPGGEVHVTPDGKHLLMNRYAELDSGETGGIWALQRTDDGWDQARFLIPSGMRATSTHNGSVYTTDITGFRVEGRDGGIIAKWTDTEEGFKRDTDPDGGVNTESVDAHPFIAPDESYIIFNSTRTGGKGKGDLYLCYRSGEGSWSEAVNMEPLNPEAAEWCATVSPDGKFLFFTRNGPGGGDIYWVNAKIIDELKPKR